MILAAAATAACLWVAPMSEKDYLFSHYQAAPHIDSTGAFLWKDEAAAKRSGRSLKDEVIGGVDLKLRRSMAFAFRLMPLWGLDPSINSAYRSNFRQSLIRNGSPAKVGRSYHGGSRVGGWGHGAAMDVVSAHAIGNQKERGSANRPVWAWIDKFGPHIGIGRPYGDWDAPHVTLVASPEYVAHHGTTHTQSARRHMHRHHRIAHHRGTRTHKRVARS